MKYVNQLDYPEIPYNTGLKLDYDYYLKYKDIIDKSNGLSKIPFQPGMAPLGGESNIAKAGCGLCSAVMVADRLNANSFFDLEDALQVSYDAHANEGVGTEFVPYTPIFAERIGASYKMTDSLEDVDECLATGGAVVAKSGGDRGDYVGVFTHGWHYIAIVGKRADGRYIILDPSQTPTKYDEPGREGKVEVDGNILYATPQVVEEDCNLFSPRYFCFWKM